MTNEILSAQVDLDQWVEAARADAPTYRTRKATHILLIAVAMTKPLRDALRLKGGVLMSMRHASRRQTTDVDFTALPNPEPFADELKPLLDDALTRAAANLGYIDLALRIQRFDRQPPQFSEAANPAIQLTIGIAERNSPAMRRFERGQAIDALPVDITFREPVLNEEEVKISSTGVSVMAYSVEEVIAEKMRAILQQRVRNRHRRQDIYDIVWLLDRAGSSLDHSKVVGSFLEKTEARALAIQNDPFSDPEIRSRTETDWSTLELEIGSLPDFGPLYDRVRAFFNQLPWPA